jgi:hypothetical protein
MGSIIFGNFDEGGIEVIERKNKLYVHYDAGAHQIVFRKDEITLSEFDQIELNVESQQEVMFAIQARLDESGINPYIQNWQPTQNA